MRSLGPDAARYWIAAQGQPVARPFHLRWFLPWMCGHNFRIWWSVWGWSWLALSVGMYVLAHHHLDDHAAALVATILVVALPGVWGPKVVRPIGVDLPAMALGALAAANAATGQWWAAIPFVLLAGSVKESAPVFAALWAWSPIPLIGLAAPTIRALVAKPAVDPVTALRHLREIHDHPIRTALAARQWRDGWVMVAPWGVCLAALLNLSPWVIVTLAVAYLQLLVATDTVRLVHTAAAPVVAIAAVQVIPPQWWPVAVVAHVFWFRKPEVV